MNSQSEQQQKLLKHNIQRYGCHFWDSFRLAWLTTWIFEIIILFIISHKISITMFQESNTSIQTHYTCVCIDTNKQQDPFYLSILFNVHSTIISSYHVLRFIQRNIDCILKEQYSILPVPEQKNFGHCNLYQSLEVSNNK